MCIRPQIFEICLHAKVREIVAGEEETPHVN